MNRPFARILITSWGMFFGSGYAWSQTVGPQSPPPPSSPQQIVGATHYDGWYTFNGNLENQKYSQSDLITPQNVGKLEKVWEVHTGDVSNGNGKIPLTDWSATPLFVNDTVYVSTPFYRIFAISGGSASNTHFSLPVWALTANTVPGGASASAQSLPAQPINSVSLYTVGGWRMESGHLLLVVFH